MIGKDSDDEDCTMMERDHLQDSEGPNWDAAFDVKSNANAKPTIRDMGSIGQPTANRREFEVQSRNENWSITTPNIEPPHTEWPINTKELDVLMPKAVFWEFAKGIFQDESIWDTRSFQQEKFTISRTTHPDIAQHWLDRMRLFAPQKVASGGKIGSVYPPFLRLLIAEFVLKWEVDYTWENENGKKLVLQVHPSVAAIGAKLKDTKDKAGGSQVPVVNKAKRKINDSQIESIPKKEKNRCTSSFVCKINDHSESAD
jgi:hypothetical protein